jgi:hypothetical protein
VRQQFLHDDFSDGTETARDQYCLVLQTILSECHGFPSLP